jgi:hypothetical protein
MTQIPMLSMKLIMKLLIVKLLTPIHFFEDEYCEYEYLEQEWILKAAGVYAMQAKGMDHYIKMAAESPKQSMNSITMTVTTSLFAIMCKTCICHIMAVNNLVRFITYMHW